MLIQYFIKLSMIFLVYPVYLQGKIEGEVLMLRNALKLNFILILTIGLLLSSCANNGGRKSMPKKKPLPCPVKDC